MRWKHWLLSVGLLLSIVLVPQTGRSQQERPTQWYRIDANKNVTLIVYLFYSDTCPHCQAAVRFSREMEKRHPWLEFWRYETSSYPQNVQYYRYLASQVGRAAGQVPAFFFCKQMEIGFDSDERTGKRLEASLQRCHEALAKQVKKAAELTQLDAAMLATLIGLAEQEPDADLEIPGPDAKVNLPWFGEVEASELSLPLLTLAIAGCDAFNPCAFFVLLFLLSLMVHAHSRPRMLLVGGIFVFASAFVYFLFMAAWLNLFFVAGHVQFITLGAGILAIGVALINIKDYFWFRQGPSLSIPDQVKPGLFQRMTLLVSEKQLLSMLAGTVVLAAVTNLYELLCTSGFPMIYTRVLTLRELPMGVYYLYLAAYNAVYVLPLAVIVLVFTLTLGSRKLSEREGRVLKLLSGAMMLVLGGLMMMAPNLLTNVWAALGALVAAILLTAGIMAVNHFLHSAAPMNPMSN